MNIPDFNTFALKYTATEDVAVGNRVFHLKISIISRNTSWPYYHIEDETDDSKMGKDQSKVVSPRRSVLLKSVIQSLKDANWQMYSDGVIQAPITHLASALQTIQNGGW